MGWVQQSVESFGSILLTKIRGYRVELAEVETALRGLENIQEAVVVDGGDDSLGEKRLIAYLVCDTHLPVSVSRLRSSLSQKLPDYMIPETFVILDAHTI